MSFLANALWYLSSLPQAVQFKRAINNVEEVQRQKLLSLLHANASTAYGRHYGFDSIRCVEDYQASVPLADYDQLRPWLDRVAHGEEHVLTAEPVRLLEPTSGSSSATKLIPYTAGLRREFQAGISPWVVSTFSRNPALLCGQSYWSVSPVMPGQPRSPGGIPIGFDEDSDYLSDLAGRAVRSVMAVPPQVKYISDLDTFRYVTLLFLLRCRRLSLISVWNPTFLMLLLQPLEEWWVRLAEDIAEGVLSAPGPIPSSVRSDLLRMTRPDPARSREITRVFEQHGNSIQDSDAGELHRRLWPRLIVLSCWADAAAEPYAMRLAKLLPQATLQPKGLIATEAFVSFPLPGVNSCALSLHSHFFEFIPASGCPAAVGEQNGESAPPLLAHELSAGQRYSVVVSTAGGLCRYRTHDYVVVTGHAGDCPLVRFAGREDAVSDWFGEKLSERHLSRALSSLLASHRIEPAFTMVACDDGIAPPAYTLYLQNERALEDALAAVGTALESALLENYHYAYCRRMGQLGPLRVFRIEGDAAGAYLRSASARNQRLGDIKPALLNRHGGWSNVFQGHVVAS